MTKAEQTQKRLDEMQAKKAGFEKELADSEPKADSLRMEIAEAALADQDTSKLERELDKLESRAKTLAVTITRAGLEVTALREQLAQEVIKEAVSRYVDLEKAGQAKLKALAAALLAFRKAQEEFHAVAVEMWTIEQQNPLYSFRSAPETKGLQIPKLGNLFKDDAYNMLYELQRMAPAVVSRPESPEIKAPAIPDRPREHIYIQMATQPGQPPFYIEKQ